ncbi:MFS transporter [Mammaliicoccus sciuri]|uniref:MFS transporter n=1 Tax=Mammaliicoccus sciuri TaxID=1296 RepID=UPI0007346370|nr:MFS transporter [Mammaliicoccus sciuri]KTT84080.1 MFS sugar transporter [Mammaliicoccus sciuri]MBF0774613.1 MFS transporter [Mammaliicoccus sciuri]MCD8885473.1 MFS transporter [Mammaliicoccus sciuri]MCJ0955362.1 MFS transporter [Mammaliicoccus sciuri]MCJ1759831.1 MFS transporter [Mammaliicoccus sciuri]
MKNKFSNQLALISLAISAFAIGSTEFISVGLLPLIKDAFDVTIPLAGLTVSLYAIGVTVGAPILTPLTNNMKRKTVLILIMVVFIIANVFAGLATSFSLLLAMRVLSAFSHGVFMSIATTIAADLVPAHKRSSAIAMMFTGLTVATITGVPFGTWVGQNFGYEMSFYTIALIGLISLIANISFVPKNLTEYEQAPIIKQLAVFKNKPLMSIYLITALGYGGTFVVYTYMTEILTNILGYETNSIVIILILYGVMVAIGNILGGKLTNHAPTKSLTIIFLLQALTLLLVGFTIHFHVVGLISILLMGLFAFMNVPGLQLIVVLFAERNSKETVNFASSLNISAFNIGITLGSVIGGFILNHLTLSSTPYFAFIMVLVASILMFVVNKHETTEPLQTT